MLCDSSHSLITPAAPALDWVGIAASFQQQQRDAFLEPMLVDETLGKHEEKRKMKSSKYVGPWNKQCPYCFAKKVLQEVCIRIEDGVPYQEWADEACCLKCGEGWHECEVQIPGCAVCGVNHSYDIGSEETSYKRADGTNVHNMALMICDNCHTYTDQKTGEVIPVTNIIEATDV